MKNYNKKYISYINEGFDFNQAELQDGDDTSYNNIMGVVIKNSLSNIGNTIIKNLIITNEVCKPYFTIEEYDNEVIGYVNIHHYELQLEVCMFYFKDNNPQTLCLFYSLRDKRAGVEYDLSGMLASLNEVLQKDNTIKHIDLRLLYSLDNTCFTCKSPLQYEWIDELFPKINITIPIWYYTNEISFKPDLYINSKKSIPSFEIRKYAKNFIKEFNKVLTKNFTQIQTMQYTTPKNTIYFNNVPAYLNLQNAHIYEKNIKNLYPYKMVNEGFDFGQAQIQDDENIIETGIIRAGIILNVYNNLIAEFSEQIERGGWQCEILNYDNKTIQPDLTSLIKDKPMFISIYRNKYYGNTRAVAHIAVNDKYEFVIDYFDDDLDHIIDESCIMSFGILLSIYRTIKNEPFTSIKMDGVRYINNKLEIVTQNTINLVDICTFMKEVKMNTGNNEEVILSDLSFIGKYNKREAKELIKNFIIYCVNLQHNLSYIQVSECIEIYYNNSIIMEYNDVVELIENEFNNEIEVIEV